MFDVLIYNNILVMIYDNIENDQVIYILFYIYQKSTISINKLISNCMKNSRISWVIYKSYKFATVNNYSTIKIV